MMRSGLRAALALAACLLAGCGTLMNVSTDGADTNLMLRGYDPVAYQAQGRATPGDAAIKAEHEGVTYRFASAGNRALFVANPQKYVAAYGGFCTTARPTRSRPEAIRSTEGGRRAAVHLRRRQGEGLLGARQARNVRLVDEYWENEMKDAPWRLQSYKRWTFKVPPTRPARTRGPLQEERER